MEHERGLSGKKRKGSQASVTSQLSTSLTAVDSEQNFSTESKQRLQADGKKSRKASTIELPFWDSEIVPLLSALENTPYSDTAKLCEVCGSLWTRLEQHNLLGRTGGVGGTKRRSAVLRTVFKLLDHKDPILLLKVAKIITAVSVQCCLEIVDGAPKEHCKNVFNLVVWYGTAAALCKSA